MLTEADHNVLKYLESNASQIPLQTLDSLRQTLGVETANSQLTTMVRVGSANSNPFERF